MAGESVYDSRAVANYLIERGNEAGRPLDPLQLMKLDYISHAWTLGLLERPLLEDDVEAWEYGPVIRRLYTHIKGGRRPIMEPVSNHQADFGRAEISIIDQVFEKYGVLSGIQLSALTHRKGTPWDITWRAYGKNAVISQDLIQRHYQDLIAQRRESIGG